MEKNSYIKFSINHTNKKTEVRLSVHASMKAYQLALWSFQEGSASSIQAVGLAGSKDNWVVVTSTLVIVD